MSTFVIVAVNVKPIIGGPHCTSRIGRLRGADPIAVRTPRLIAAQQSGRRRQPAEQLVAHRLALRSDQARLGDRHRRRVGAVEHRTEVPAVPDAAGVPAAAARRRAAAAAGLRRASTLSAPGCGRTARTCHGISISKIFRRSAHRGTLRERARVSRCATNLPLASSCGPFQDCGITFWSSHLATSALHRDLGVRASSIVAGLESPAAGDGVSQPVAQVDGLEPLLGLVPVAGLSSPAAA